MTADSRFERDLPAVLEDCTWGRPPTTETRPWRTAAARGSGPSWTFAGRWLPMADIASRPAFAPRVPWRTVGVALLVIALILAAGARHRRSRTDQGPAAVRPGRNGLIVYASDGDISRSIRSTARTTPS